MRRSAPHCHIIDAALIGCSFVGQRDAEGACMIMLMKFRSSRLSGTLGFPVYFCLLALFSPNLAYSASVKSAAHQEIGAFFKGTGKTFSPLSDIRALDMRMKPYYANTRKRCLANSARRKLS
jgi:hypothetical protein